MREAVRSEPRRRTRSGKTLRRTSFSLPIAVASAWSGSPARRDAEARRKEAARMETRKPDARVAPVEGCPGPPERYGNARNGLTSVGLAYCGTGNKIAETPDPAREKAAILNTAAAARCWKIAVWGGEAALARSGPLRDHGTTWRARLPPGLLARAR